jgi:peptidoglycan/LPS O-acetylase OafA/YrhL
MRHRLPQLDLLRGIAVLMVMLCHYPLIRFATRTGWAGVDLFFVLSGFLISGLLFTEWKRSGTIILSRFFIRRGFKIYPAFYFFLITLLPAMLLVGAGKGTIGRRFLAEVFFIQNYLPHFWVHTWSLAVEEQFYILLAILLFALSRLRAFAIIPAISLLLMVACLALRLVAGPTHANSIAGDQVPFIALHLRADALFAGVALGYLFNLRESIFKAISRWWLLPMGLAFLLPLLLGALPLPYVLTCNTLGFACLLAWIVPRNSVRLPWLERVGTYSYSIYLWHYAVASAFTSFFHPRFIWMLAYIAVSIAIGVYMGRIIELRAIEVRDRLFPANTQTSSARAPQQAPSQSGRRGNTNRPRPEASTNPA